MQTYVPSALAVSHPQFLETGRAQLSGGLRHTKHAWRIPEIRKVTEGYALPYDCKGLTERPLVSSNPVLLSKLTDSLARSSIKHLRVNSRCLIGTLLPWRRFGSEQSPPMKRLIHDARFEPIKALAADFSNVKPSSVRHYDDLMASV